MDDVLKNVNRFVVNNFQDDAKQAVIEIVLGKYEKDQLKDVHIRNAALQSIDYDVQQMYLGLFVFWSFFFMNFKNSSTEACKTWKPLSVHIGTWNVNAKRPHEESLLQWLEFNNTEEPDIYVLGFQELVELSAKQVIKTDGYERVAWENLILRTLNPNGENKYVLLRSEQLVGACLSIFIKVQHVPDIMNVDVCTEKVSFFSFSFVLLCLILSAQFSDERSRLASPGWPETRVVLPSASN